LVVVINKFLWKLKRAREGEERREERRGKG